MATQRIPEDALAWVQALALHATHLPLVTELATALGAHLTTETLRQEFVQKSGLPARQASLVISGLMNLLHTADSTLQPIPDVLAWMTSDLRRAVPETWTAQYLTAWEAALPAIQAALDRDGPLAVLHKTMDLAHAHENLWLSAQIFTDIRPVFSSDAKRILRAVVTHMLAATYRDAGDEERTTHFALDSVDIRKLREACDRALTKVETVKTAVAGLPWSTDIAGETA